MPRSKRRIEIDNLAIKRGREVLQTAMKDFTGKPQAAVIAERIQGNTVWANKIEKDRPLLRYLWVEGLKMFIRDALMEWGLLIQKGEAPPQLELFAEDERDIVRRIGMARIWVPSRNAHVQYHGLAGEILKEAARFYRSLSAGNLRTAVLLEQLATLRDQRPPSAQAA